MKIKLSTLRAIAAGQGYAGDEADFSAMKSFLVALDPPLQVNKADGSAIDIKSLELDAPAPRTVTLPEEPAAKSDAAFPADVDAKLRSMVADLARKSGIDTTAGGRPALADPKKDMTVSTVKSGEERQFEDRAKSGEGVFSNYAAAKRATLELASKAAIASGKADQAITYQRQAGELLEHACKSSYATLSQARGAALMTEQIDTDIVRLIKEYGVARKACRMVPMTTMDVKRARKSGMLTVYYPDEGTAGTTSVTTFDTVSLRAKKGITITKMSREIADDARIDLFEDTARDIAEAIAKVEDESLFNGTGGGGSGTGYIPQVEGIITKIAGSSSNSRLLKSSASTPGAITIADLTLAMGKLPSWARSTRTAWHCTPEIMNIVLTRLGAAQGGVTFREFMDYGDVPFVLGRPVILNNVMRATNDTGANNVILLYGDVSLAADFGSRLDVEVDISDQRYWDEANFGVRGLVRHDIHVHSLGSTTTQSPVVALTIT
jgi:HK97 family phage major capsid protein